MPLVETGKLLVARPSLLDPNFRRTVVLVFQHGAAFGTMGVVVNRPTAKKLRDVVEQIEGVHGRDDVLWNGGPVQPNAVWVLHRRADLDDKGEEVAPGMFLGGSPKLLTALLRSTPANPAPVVFRTLRGYAGWAPGQLAREVREGAWRVLDADPDVLFGAEGDPLWDEALVRAQLPFKPAAHVLRHAHLN